jgi:nitroimidazol reductase NimA-like FMN-containing flavoprotein (pyridoxamine 5'-phosphate oxidase superfamily)
VSELLGAIQDRTFARAAAATTASYPSERRLSAAQLTSYLDRRAFAVVGSTRADGRPHAAMSAYVRRGAAFWLPTVADSVRERNLRGTPWLTMVIAEGDHDEHVAVLIEGRAEVVAPPQVPADVRAAITGDWVSAWICLTAERLLSYAAEGTLP